MAPPPKYRPPDNQDNSIASPTGVAEQRGLGGWGGGGLGVMTFWELPKLNKIIKTRTLCAS